MSAVQDAIGSPAGGERAAVVGVAGRQVADHGVDDTLRHLRAAGSVEEDRHLAVARTLQGGELLPKAGDVEGVHGHSLPRHGIFFAQEVVGEHCSAGKGEGPALARTVGSSRCRISSTPRAFSKMSTHSR